MKRKALAIMFVLFISAIFILPTKTSTLTFNWNMKPGTTYTITNVPKNYKKSGKLKAFKISYNKNEKTLKITPKKNNKGKKCTITIRKNKYVCKIKSDK